MFKKLILAAIFALLFHPSASAGEFEDLVMKANDQVQKQSFQKALPLYQKAYAINPQNGKINLLIGLTYANTGDLNQALKFTQKSLEIEPSYTGYHNLGLIYANKGDYAKSDEAYRKSLGLNPSSHRVWYQLGLLQATHGNFEKAVESYEKCLTLNPKFTKAYLGLASAHYWSGHSDEAQIQVERLRKINAREEADVLQDWIEKRESSKQTSA